ncbi:MAG: protein translocase subunit SecD [Verrucomicrobiales bacterium]|nr:protein translocase subunit SecD [Verrucomicrobiales bacterium]
MAAGIIFLMGITVLFAFAWYFGTESVSVKRRIGTLLAIGVTAGSLYFYEELGIEKGIELKGGIAVNLRIQQGSDKMPITRETQETVIAVLERRLNKTGTKELILAPQGSDRIFLQMPSIGEEEASDIVKMVTKAAKLEFAIIPTQQDDRIPGNAFILGNAVNKGTQIVPGYKAVALKKAGEDDKKEKSEGEEGAEADKDEDAEKANVTQYVLMKLKADMSGNSVTQAYASFDQQGWGISITFDNDGAQQFGELSAANPNRQMAIILDGEVISYPAFNSGPIWGGSCRISGDFSQVEAKSLAAAMANPLKEPLTKESVSFISPTMGAATVKQGITAGVAGLSLTLLFILVYYRVAGVLAILGMLINIAIIFGSMALFKFTLTLPGIAGIILTIGIAIDANVLIYERLREEMTGGKSLHNAIKTAYGKALSAIIDANITTLITAVILYMVATGTVKGFAITLILGIMASLFSALLVTRVCFSWLVTEKGGLVKKLSFANIAPKRQFDFLSKRRVALAVSAVLVVLSLVVSSTKDPRGVDLKGGDLLTIHSPGDVTTEKIEQTLQAASFKGFYVQKQHAMGGGGEFLTVRSVHGSGDKIKAVLKKDLQMDVSEVEVESVGSLVGSEMLKTSLMALGFGMIAILLYVTLRFEFAFALGALVALVHDLIIVLGLVTVSGLEISLITVGAFLTIAGYSINDSIVVFDRVREGLKTKRGDVKDIMNFSLNATLSRTLLTSLTTMLTLLTLYIFGGPSLNNFAFTLIAGVIVGTYSSIYVASPIVLWWARKSKTNLRREVLDSEQEKIQADTPTIEA